MSKDDFFERLGEAGKLKHDLLSQYLPTWLNILGSAYPSGLARTLHYVDTHAGPGRYVQDQALGSPLLALAAAERVLESRQGFNLSAHFIESKKEHVEALNLELSRMDIDPNRVRVKVWPGDFAEELPRVLEGIPRGEALFTFIDPFGYDVPMSLVRSALAGRRYAEVFLTLMSDFMARFASDGTKTTTLTNVIGSGDWKSFIDQPGVKPKILELYCLNIVRDPEGARPSRDKRLAFPIEIKPGTTKDVYALIHISHAAFARQVMESAAKAALGAPQQMLISDPRTKDLVLDVLGGRTMEALEVAAGVWRESPFLWWDPHVRQALGELHASGAIEVFMFSKVKGYVPRLVGKPIAGKDRISRAG